MIKMVNFIKGVLIFGIVVGRMVFKIHKYASINEKNVY